MESHTNIQLVHISRIQAGDTVRHRGVMKTVCPKDLTYDKFMGHRLFGDSYVLGHKAVKKITWRLQ